MGWLNTAIGAGAGFVIGGPAGAAIGAGMGSQVDTNQANAERADAANAWSAAQYANRYQTTKADLEAAGYNPMLAYSQGAGTAPTAQQVQFQNPVSAGLQSYSQFAGAEQAFASAGQAEAAGRLADSNVDKVKEEIKNIPLEGRRLERLSALLAEQLNVAFQETQSKIQAISVMKQTFKKLEAETSLLKNQVQVEESLNNLGRTSKELAPAAKILLDIFRSTK